MIAKLYVSFVLVTMTLAAAAEQHREAFVCPLNATIAPCSCSFAKSIGTGVALDCYNKGLTDAQMSNILNAFLSSTAGISPLTKLNAQNNSLTKVPGQILKMTASLWDINLACNKITSIPPGAFSSPSATNIGISLYSNQITSLPSKSFNLPSANTIAIILDSNRITSLPQGMFN